MLKKFFIFFYYSTFLFFLFVVGDFFISKYTNLFKVNKDCFNYIKLKNKKNSYYTYNLAKNCFAYEHKGATPSYKVYTDSNGFRIILISARKESSREMTEKHVQSLGLPYDQLILGVNNGSRYLINDKLSFDDPDRAVSINLITDSGFESVDWEGFGL